MARARKSKFPELSPRPDPEAALDPAHFLSVATGVLELLTDDLLARADESPAVSAALKLRHAHEKQHKRTADGYAVWRRRLVVQIAAAWLLSCVFVRTLEDRGLLARNRLAGPGALDAQRAFFGLAPNLGIREYLLTIFAELEHFAAVKGLFDREHNLCWRLAPSQEGAKALVELFRGGSADQPYFRFGQQSTRFLGDLYQDLSEDVRKRYALLQTPDFVESYILDRTLEPAIAEFGLREFKIIDPTCGSGHFLLGAFERVYDKWSAAEPGGDNHEHVRRALGSVFGADVNAYAVFIARFRLTLAAVGKLGVGKIDEVPELALNVVVADSLIFGAGKGQAAFADMLGQAAAAWNGEEFALEDEDAAKRVLAGGFEAVVGNPPYITVKDKILRDRYRELYSAAYREYSLSVPFMQAFFGLARKGGFVGQVTSNSFMKREFGKLVIEQFIPTIDMQTIVNTSGAYIPGHGTPTVILFGRNRAPESDRVHAMLARRGEPSTPDDPAQGLVWSAIRDHGDELGYEDEYITVAQVERGKLGQHPWSLEGGGAGELKALIEERAEMTAGELVDSIGFMCITKQDDVFTQPSGTFTRWRVSRDRVRPFVIGEMVRDWGIEGDLEGFFPYDEETNVEGLAEGDLRALWRFRAILECRAVFGGKTFKQANKKWYEYGQIPTGRSAGPSIGFAEVATHNHFALDRGGKVFKQTAPIIKLPEDASEDDHLALLAYLNSSTACFWMKQVFYPKASAAGDLSTEKMRPEANRYAFAGTALTPLPLPPWSTKQRQRATKLARKLDALATELAQHDGEHCIELITAGTHAEDALSTTETKRTAIMRQMVALQEQLDWLIYEIFGLIKHPVELPDTLDADERWFVSKDAKRWPKLAQEFKGNASLSVLEDPVFKRLWLGRQGVFGHGTKTLREAAQDAARQRALAAVEDQLESADIRSVEALRDAIGADPNLPRMLSELDLSLDKDLLESEAIPFLAALRFKPSGLEKHAAWQQTWALQRREDAGETIAEIPVPPKYAQSDFSSASCWRLRGKLDVPKERFIAYPGLESDRDAQPLYGWAGWNHAQRAEALFNLYHDRRDEDGWPAERLTPILAGILELLPWIEQWHNEPDEDGERLADAYETFLAEELRSLGLTRDELRAWRPAKKTRGGRKKKAKQNQAKHESKAKAEA